MKWQNIQPNLDCFDLKPLSHQFLYHAMENINNQNTGKQYTPQYNTTNLPIGTTRTWILHGLCWLPAVFIYSLVPCPRVGDRAGFLSIPWFKIVID